MSQLKPIENLFEGLDEPVEPKAPPRPEDELSFPTWMVPPLCNVYRPMECFQWYRLIYLRDDEDLELEEYATRDLGTPAKWVTEETDCEPEYLLNPTWPHVKVGVGRWDFTTRWIEWGIHHGLCPGQPFLIWFSKPEWYQSGGYEYPSEWDMSQDWDLVGRMPRSDAQASRSWDRAFTQIHEVRDRAREGLRELVHKRAHDVSAMSVKVDYYGMHHNIVSYSLRTKHIRGDGTSKSGHPSLVEGRDEGGDHKVAYENLVKKALKRFPHLNRERLDSLRDKRVYRPSSWERIVKAC